MSGKLVQEEDRIAIGKIIAVAIISLAIFGVGALWSISIQRAENHSIITPMNPAPQAEKGVPEVGIVYQWPFNESDFGPEHAKKMKARLESYGWTDKSAKVAHIPIDEAMKKYVAQAGGGK